MACTIYAQQLKTATEDIVPPNMTPLEQPFIKIFFKSRLSKILKDSVSMYAINFTMDVVKDKNNKTLKDINGTAYTDKQYKMAAIYGLNYSGERTYNYLGNNLDLYAIYKSKLGKTYNNLPARYGITVAERDAFYLENLKNVAADKKLPTYCP